MNHTASGAIAVGHSHSRARYAAESEHARNSQYVLLMLTEEGQKLLTRFAKSCGADFALMLEHEKENPGSIARYLDEHYAELFSFLCGVEFAAYLA